MNPKQVGTKVGLQFMLQLARGESEQIHMVLTNNHQASPFEQFTSVFAQRIEQAYEFYDHCHHRHLRVEESLVQRQALAGMLWPKQYYVLDMRAWLSGDNLSQPPPASRLNGRNQDWDSLSVADVISMPDKWEYPWFAAWDWAFHTILLAMVDIEFAKGHLELMLSEKLQHPNGQIPAYEWSFPNVNPPAPAWPVWPVY